jgi:hypothetical protein
MSAQGKPILYLEQENLRRDVSEWNIIDRVMPKYLIL